MKKLLTILSLFFLGLGFISCEDELTASTLEGTWEGDMYVYSEYNGRTYYATNTQIEFLTDPLRFTSGSGYWVDYYSNAPWDYYASHIKWSVKDRVIYVYFIEDDEEVQIWDYRLDDDRFCGTIHGAASSTDFWMVHTSSPRWGDYDYGWDYWTRSATRSGEVEKPVRHIGR